MGKLKSTVGFVGENGVVLKDHSVFDKGDVVVLISAENINELLGELMEIKENMDMSKRWIDEIKEIE
ncbi:MULTISPECIES: hypothetical protein [Methanobacterium]|uniref:RCK C-terminal domain-containing protein n=1 Tax=Methanobacterium bryantii TaxID=2161 RepID=A0A2A2H856_METBR|nr:MULTISPECIES: hypothetical protein [Methanobacterium]OEC84461.1 hypothetical protein A9507_15480 [Methanobacterium sp. A39]PAV05568.1 hypothetical protein ASJ80_08625 [Methanobacterium bryantii]